MPKNASKQAAHLPAEKLADVPVKKLISIDRNCSVIY